MEFWFGWLLKGEAQVSGLDRIIFLGELIVLVVLGIFIFSLVEEIKSKLK